VSSYTKCIITGCALRLEHAKHYAWGDLFLQGGRFIFNANTEDGETRWLDPDNPIDSPMSIHREVVIPADVGYWSRRGVYVFQAHIALLNNEAQRYIGADLASLIREQSA